MQVQYDQPVWNQKLVYYTAKKLDGSTAITDEIFPGYAFFKDLTNTTIPLPGGASAQTKDGLGVTVTQCQDDGSGDNRPYFAGIATNVPRGFKGPGWVWVISCGDGVDCYTKANMTIDPVTYLGGASGEWSLAAVSGSIATAADIMLLIARICAKPLKVQDTSGTAANVKCDVGPVGGVGGA